MAINEEQAMLVSQNFLKEKNITHENALSKTSLMELVKKDGLDMYYIVNLGDRDGFVIVSASEFLDPIIGYSLDSEFQWQPEVQYYLDHFSDFILKKSLSGETPDANITKQWEHFLQKDFVPNSVRAVGLPPLISSRWNQNKFYNTYCPWDIRAGSGYDYRVPNGCVALATAQLMNYYRHPETGKDAMIYTPFGYPTQSVYLSQHKYNWDAMCDRATNYTNEIAKLAYHIGVMVKMGYAPDGSGASTDDVAAALEKNFFYTHAIVWDMTDSLRFKKELDLLRPILMSGCSEGGCHAFLMDGYDENLFMHYNWGWGGAADGYFTTNSQLFPTDGHTYLSIKPANNYPIQCQQYKIQTASQGYVTNGSTNMPYTGGPDCSWIIAAPKATQYSFSFSRLDTKEDIDVVTIYNGSNRSAGVAATFSGNKTPTGSTVVNADSVLITFTSIDPTAENTTHRGFLMNYTTNKPQQNCQTATQITTPTGYITDGTKQGENYTSASFCTWNFDQDYCTGIYVIFHEFDLKLGDFIDIFDASNSQKMLWRRFDRYTPPNIGEAFFIPASKVQMQFITDNFDQGNGFKMQYFSVLGINDHSLLDNLSIYPNPASNYINLSFTSELVNQSIICRLMDVTGKEVFSTPIEYHGDLFNTQIPVANLSKGFYFLQLITTAGQTTSKIIIN